MIVDHDTIDWKRVGEDNGNAQNIEIFTDRK